MITKTHLFTDYGENQITDCFPYELEPNQQLPTVRDLASEAGVNPNTIQSALSDLEREGFVYSKRTTGRFVTEDLDLIVQSRKQLSEEELNTSFPGMDPIWL